LIFAHLYRAGKDLTNPARLLCGQHVKKPEEEWPCYDPVAQMPTRELNTSLALEYQKGDNSLLNKIRHSSEVLPSDQGHKIETNTENVRIRHVRVYLYDSSHAIMDTYLCISKQLLHRHVCVYLCVWYESHMSLVMQ
jgi:hypothetical protein